MQMNRWLAPLEPEDEDDSYHPVRPRASVWIDPLAQQSVSASYLVKEQRVIPNPQTPIPARASAPHAAHTVKVRPRYTQNVVPARENDITQVPTLPERTGTKGPTGPTRSTISALPTRPTMWQYELADYEAESSLPSLSLAYPEPAIGPALDELDTLPPPKARRIEDIDEIDTLVPPKQHSPAAQKSPTGSPGQKLHTAGLSNSSFTQSTGLQRQKSVTLPAPHAVSMNGTISPGAATVAVPRMPIGNQKLDFLAKVQQEMGGSASLIEDGASWTAGQAKNSPLAKRIASPSQRKSTLSLNPLDRLRWWLLVPGRIEFLLWLSGTIVLVGVTCMLLFATLLSTGWSNPRLSSIGASGTTRSSNTSGSTATRNSSCTAANAKSPQCHSTTVVSANGLQLTLVNNALLLPGMPIYVHGHGFTLNNTVSFSYDAALPCRPDAISTDGQGNFSLYLMLDAGTGVGIHHIMAYDVATKHGVSVTVTISPPPIDKPVSPSPTRTTPGATPTATSGTSGGGALPPPVGQTPIPITPTVAVTTTESPTQQPTPTIGITATPGKVSTVGITVTVAPHVTSTVGTQGTAGAASILKNALYEEHADGHATLSVWLWLAIIGYALSMTLLGCAGLLYRRNRRMSSK